MARRQRRIVTDVLLQVAVKAPRQYASHRDEKATTLGLCIPDHRFARELAPDERTAVGL
jgi:hypothetical protein